MNVKNNVGRIFLGILNSSFPEGHALKPIFNRNTLKLSYSCMPNVQNAIDAHNKAQLKKPVAERPKNCNCRDKPNCPLNGECRVKSIVYQATVTTPRTGPNNTNNCHGETYVGLTDTEFKLRYANHKVILKPENKKRNRVKQVHLVAESEKHLIQDNMENPWQSTFILQQNKEMQPLPVGKVPHNLPPRQSQPEQEV